MKCEDVMTRDPKCCVPTDNAMRAAKLMKIEDVGSVPICGSHETRRLVGIVTDRDLALQVVATGRDPQRTPLGEIMTREPLTCRWDEELEVALGRMESSQVRRIPVVDRNGLLAGIISQADIALRSRNAQKTAEVVEEISQPSGLHE